jgi:hypothetical protein
LLSAVRASPAKAPASALIVFLRGKDKKSHSSKAPTLALKSRRPSGLTTKLSFLEALKRAPTFPQAVFHHATLFSDAMLFTGAAATTT